MTHNSFRLVDDILKPTKEWLGGPKEPSTRSAGELLKRIRWMDERSEENFA
jgi:hypothetical protein